MDDCDETMFHPHGSTVYIQLQLGTDQNKEESSQGGVSDTDDVGSVSVPVDDEGFETLAAEIKEVLAELAQVFYFFYILS